MKKLFFKKVLAVLCVVMLLPLGSFYISAQEPEGTGASDAQEAEATNAADLRGYTELTLLDAGISDCVDQQKDGYNSLNVETLDDTLFSIRLAYSAANGSRFHYGVNSTNSYSGISFRLEMAGGKEVLTVGNEVASSGITNLPWTLTALDPVTAGVGETFVNTEFLLQISTQFVDYDGGGADNDIKLGIFINGKLYNNQYYYINDSVDQLGTNINFNEGTAALLGSYTRDSEIDFAEWTIRDIYLSDGQLTVNKTGIAAEGTLAGSSFSAIVEFPDSHLNLWIGTGENNGMVFQGSGENIAVYYVIGGNYKWNYTLTKDEAGCSLTENHNLKLTLTTEKVGTKGMKFGIYFDDQLYGGRHFYVADAADLNRNLQIVPWEGGTVYLAVPEDTAVTAEKELSPVSYDLADGAYLLTGKKITVNGVLAVAGDTLNAPGDYTIEKTDAHTKYTQKVSLYRVGDMDLNGTPGEAGDLSKLKELLNGVTNVYTADCAAEYAADLDNDGKVGWKDLELMEGISGGSTTLDVVLEKYHAAALTYDYLGGDEVMPIVGYYGPNSEDGSLTEEVFRLIKECGVNLINGSSNQMGEDADSYALKVMEMAEKYGIGYYMKDIALNAEANEKTGTYADGNTLSNVELAGYLGRYSYYESFLGTNVKDEPTPNIRRVGIPADDSINLMKYYDNVAAVLNQFTNMSGFINVLPSSAVNDAVYGTHLEDVRDNAGAKVLSFDHYPFSEIDSSTGEGKEVSNVRDYFFSLNTVRQTAGTEVPFWGHVQAGGDWRDNSSKGATQSDLLPSEAETYWNVNTMLVFGAKGIEWFPLVQPMWFSYDDTTESQHDYDRNGLIGADQSTTTFYNYAKRINAHIAAIDEVLMKAISTGVIATEGYAKSQTAKCGDTMISATDMLTGVTSDNAAYGALVGCFDYRDTEAFYVMNYNVTAPQNITLNFNSTYDYRQIQNAVTTYGTGNTVTLKVPAGEAVLVVLEDRVVGYTLAEHVAYCSVDGNLVPDAEPGYVFAGWFADEGCTMALDIDLSFGEPFALYDDAAVFGKEKSTEKVYAKFTDENVLTVKAQITAGTMFLSPKTDIRFVTTVDSLDYKEVGFEIEIEGLAKNTVFSTTVYKKLYAVGSKTLDEIEPGIFSSMSEYFNTYSYWNVPAEHYDTNFIVTPYWITLDGTTVYGETAVKTISMGIHAYKD